MNLLHYLNVAIGFSLVMLLLSIVTTFAAQAWLVVFRTKSRAVGNGLARMLQDIGLDKTFAEQNVDALLNTSSSIFGERIGRAIRTLRAYLLAGAPQDIGREEFLLLLLRRAGTDKELAQKLGFTDDTHAKAQLEQLEQAMLIEETNNPTVPAHVWRTKAMRATVPGLASKIFARFDEVLDRVSDEVSGFGKLLGILITLPLLLVVWPVDSIDLLKRLSKDEVLSAKLAATAETILPSFQQAYDEYQRCRDRTNSPDNKDACAQSDQALKNAANDMLQLGEVKGLFGETADQNLACTIPLFDIPIPFYEDCKRAALTSGIVVTWILVSLGSAFWLGLLHKVLGLRSELSNKLHAEREFRATSQG